MTEPASPAVSAPAGATPPAAKRVPVERRLHGETVVDEYAWLRDRDDPDVIAYLEAENAYTADVLAPTSDLRQTVFEEIKARTQETDLSVPVAQGPVVVLRPDRRGPAVLRSVAGVSGRATTRSTEQVLIDFNEVAGDSPYFDVGALRRQPGPPAAGLFGRLRRRRDLHDAVQGPRHRRAPAPTRSRARTTARPGRPTVGTLFYVTPDEAMRPHRLWRHRLGTAVADDELVLRGERRAVLRSACTSPAASASSCSALGSMVTSEVRVLPADDPTGEFSVVEPRRQGVEYSRRPPGRPFLIVTNDEARELPAGRGAGRRSPGREHWRDVIPHRAGTRLQAVDAFAGHLVVPLRRDGLRGSGSIRTTDGDDRTTSSSTSPCTPCRPRATTPSSTPTVSGSTTPRWSRRRRSSTTTSTPATRTLRKRQPVLGGFDPEPLRVASVSGPPRPTARRSRSRWCGGVTTPRTAGAVAAVRLRRLRGEHGPRLLHRPAVAARPRARRSPSPTSGAAARWAGAGTRTASCCAKRNTFTDFVAARRPPVERAATPVPTGWSAGAAAPAGC